MLPLFIHAQTSDDSLENKWSGLASAYYYIIPGEKEPPTITACADYKKLHVETRFNYEDINSASVFAGYNWEHDGKVSITATPMIGFAFGRTNAMLPGLEFNADYKRINLYSENEYLINFKGRASCFFYSWTQLNVETIKNLKLGFAAQSLRWYKTKFDIQRGPYAEYAAGIFNFDTYYFNPFTGYDFVVIAATVNF